MTPDTTTGDDVPAGRPHELTPKVAAGLVKAIKAGLTYKLAAQRVGIAPSTFYDWLARGRAGDAPEFVQLMERVREAEAVNAEACVRDIRRAAGKDWKAAAWMLERRFPSQYGRRDAPDAPAKQASPTQVVEVVVRAAETPALAPGRPGQPDPAPAPLPDQPG